MASGIVLYAKKRGPTSFNSLHNIKKALQTKKVGHTGTLDSFAEGLLVVMVGSLTRLVSHVTAFDKTYEAIIQFGTQTDTLDPFGEVIDTQELPLVDDFKKAFENHIGTLQQFPPQYSAIHINGKRASDIARSGKNVDMPSRDVTVFSSSIDDMHTVYGRVAHAKVTFHVSKGTYIRSLARDIAKDCSSCAHLIALRRTAVGSFLLKDAVGYSDMPFFTIESAIEQLHAQENNNKNVDTESLYNEITKHTKSMTKALAQECGMGIAVLKQEYEFHFSNGKPLKKSLFISDKLIESNYAVFTEKNIFIGIIIILKQHDNYSIRYGFVLHP